LKKRSKKLLRLRICTIVFARSNARHPTDKSSLVLSFKKELLALPCPTYLGQFRRMRLFVALDLPWPLRERLSGLGVGLQGARWVPPEKYHATLRFIGEVPRHTAEEIDLALAALRGRAFPLVLAGVGTHEKAGRSTALWVGVERNQALDHLQGKIETALQRVGLPPERRRFAPHVTLARLDNAAEPKLGAWVQAHNLFRSDPVQVAHFTLFSSRLGKEQSVYEAEVEYGLT
jgi:2'-5' RNA ligase